MSTLTINDWIDQTDSNVVMDIAQEKRFIWHAICGQKALNFDKQDYIIKDIRTMVNKVRKNRDNNEPTTTPKKSTAVATRWLEFDIRAKEHKNAIREYSKEVDTILDTLVMLVDEGYDLVIKRGDKGSTVRTMLFCNVENHPHTGFALSASAPDAWLSIAALVYKHSVGFSGTWPIGGEVDGDEGWS